MAIQRLHECPFCGERDLVYARRDHPKPGVIILCQSCGATGPTGNDQQNACRLWNVRADIFS